MLQRRALVGGFYIAVILYFFFLHISFSLQYFLSFSFSASFSLCYFHLPIPFIAACFRLRYRHSSHNCSVLPTSLESYPKKYIAGCVGCSRERECLLVINEMDLGRCTRCIFITWALLIIVCQTTTSTEKSDTHNANGNQFSLVLSGRFTLRSGNMLNTVYFSHRALFLTLLGTLCLALLSCAGKLAAAQIASVV